ncbi:carbohydrate sulfotransferase 11-like [Oculina patagonica]
MTHSFNKRPTQEDLQYIAVDDENKIIYCALQKVASKTWIEVLERLRGMELNPWRWEVFPRFGEYSEKEKSLRLKTYFKFFFVREPLQRTLSAFKDRIVRHYKYGRKYRRDIIQAFRPQDYEKEGDNNITFSEFIQYYSRNISRNQHWRQYEKICHPCVINYDFIGHYETLADDGPLVLKMAGIDDRVTFPPIHISTNTSEVLEYYSQVPPEYLTRFGELYRNDFDMFGYEYLGPVKKLLN